jgi:YebC/PmpR family DNA-binding regulatory protein
MAGHSHWANIKRKKEANDAQKGKLFGRVTREIILAVSAGGGNTDPNSNIALRTALDKAREVGLPKDNIARIFDRAKEKASALVEVVYEATMGNGASFMIKTATDNPRRTHSELALLLDRNGGKLVEKGGVSYLYDLCGEFFVETLAVSDILSLVEALEGFELEETGDGYYIYIEYQKMSEASNKAKELGITKAPELVYRAKSGIELPESDQSAVVSLYEKLEEHDDVQAVYTNVLLK